MFHHLFGTSIAMAHVSANSLYVRNRMYVDDNSSVCVCVCPQFFSYSAMNASSPSGWVIILSTLFNSIVSAAVLCFVVERAKKCLDFAFTNHFIHLIACTMYEGFPSTWEWWITNSISLTVMAVIGEYLCMRRELREIRISDFLSMRSTGSAM